MITVVRDQQVQDMVLKVCLDNEERFKHVKPSRIVSVRISGPKKARFAARIWRLSPLFKVFAPEVDFVVGVYACTWDTLESTPEKREILIYHELLHIHPGGKGLLDHDVQDFSEIIEQYGLRWLEKP